MKNKILENLPVQSKCFYAIKDGASNKYIYASWQDKSSIWTKDISESKQFCSYYQAMIYRDDYNLLGTDVVLINMTCTCLGVATR